jgi:hypothetical protein
MKHLTQYYIRLLALCLSLITITGCIREGAYTPDIAGFKDKITLEMIISGFQEPITRSIEDGKGEAMVENLDLLVFDNFLLYQKIKVTEFTQQHSESEYKVQYKIKSSEIPESCLIVAVANARDKVDLLTINMEKKDVLASLKHSTQADEKGTYKWNTEKDKYIPIPMYGEQNVSGLLPGSRVSFPLTRMLARIDVQNEVNADIFQLNNIYVVNYVTEGYIAPPWNKENGILLQESDDDYPYLKNLNPFIPASAAKPDVIMDYEYIQEKDKTGTMMAGEIYTYEAVKATVDGDENAVCLILYGNYRGEDYYYRIDFTKERTDPDSSVESVQYMPLYRNHKYIVKVISAEGIGYKTMKEAIASTTVLSNLKTTLQVVDLANIKEIIYNGQNFMGVESRSTEMVWAYKRKIHHRVSSNYHGSWVASVIDPTGEGSWLKLIDNNQPQVTISGIDINEKGFNFSVDALAVYPAASNSARIAFTAGRLRDTVTVYRVPIVKMFARSNVMMVGSDKLAFAVTAEDNLAMPAHSQGIFFKWGSLIGLSPSSAQPANESEEVVYDPKYHVLYNPTGQSGWGTGLAGWDKIPYGYSWYGFNVPLQTVDDADMFREFNNNTGFDQSTGVGDICRYISSKGWVEGKWRMPTYSEIMMLEQETSINKREGSFVDITEQVTDADKYGTFNPKSGFFLGYEVNSTTSNTTTPPEMTSYWPASGHRYPNGDGRVVHTGAYGYYWTGTPYTPYTVNYPFLSNGTLEFNDADRSYAFPIRCIKDY